MSTSATTPNDGFSRALALDPASVPSWTGLSESRREGGLWSEAAAAADRAVRAAPDDEPALTAAALAKLGANDAFGALETARRAVAARPEAASARRALALALLRAGWTEEAEREAETGRRLDPTHPEVLAALALTRMMRGRPDEADRLFVEALAIKDSMAEAHGNHAVALIRLGRGDEAARAAARAIQLKPFLTGPLVLLGNLLRERGRPAEAAAALAAALETNPDLLSARVNLADTLRLLGRARDAAATCLDGLERRPNHPDLLINLGAALQSEGDRSGAIDAYERALAAGFDRPIVHNNLARLHWEGGRPDLALAELRAARAQDPNDPDVAGNLASALLETGVGDPASLTEAASAAEIAVASDRPEAWAVLGRIRALNGRIDEAEIAFREALRRAPDNAETWFQAGVALLRAGGRSRSLGYLRRLVRLAPDDARAWTMLGGALRGLRFVEVDADLRADLLAALRHPAVEVAHLGEAVLSVVVSTPAWRALRTARRDPVAVVADLRRGAYDELARDPLLSTFLETAVVADPEVEADLTALRTALLAEAADPLSSIPDADPWPRFAAALAVQCFLNEYIFNESEAETAALPALENRLTTETILPGRLAVFAAYRPLHGRPLSERLTAEPRPDVSATLVRRLLDEPRREAVIEAGLPVLTPIADAVSVAVRRQYEESPHPRWFGTGLLARPLPVPAVMRAMFPHLVVESDPRWDAPEILVAGCGTGRESIWAADQFAGARVLAVDLSRAGLAYAARQAIDLGVPGITHAQADLTELAGLGRTFDIIQSVGVLHHLADPLAGWRVLTGLLRPRGLMKIGLYSEAARRSIVAGREIIARDGHDSSLEGIRRFRRVVLDLPADHPVKPVAHSVDFHSASACRDLLFHVRERRLTLPEIARWMEELELEFIGFQFEDPETPGRYRVRFPDDPTSRSLTNWDRFEAERPATFGAMYQFWVRRKP